jgi:hypothetical protein
VKKKSYIAVKKVREFIDQQPDEVQAEYLKIVEQLEKDGRLIEPFGKKLDSDLFEIRVRRTGSRALFLLYGRSGDRGSRVCKKVAEDSAR